MSANCVSTLTNILLLAQYGAGLSLAFTAWRIRVRDVHGSIFCGPTRPADHKQTTDPTRLDQLMMTPKVEFSTHSVNINALDVVKFIFRNGKSSKNYIARKVCIVNNKINHVFMFKKMSRIFDPTRPAIIYNNFNLAGPDSRVDPTRGHLWRVDISHMGVGSRGILYIEF